MKLPLPKMTANHTNEDGFILVLSLIFLVILSLMAINSVRTSTIELKIAGNERVAKLNLYNAEMVSFEGVQKNLNFNTAEELNPNVEFFDDTKNPSLKNAKDDDDDMENLDQDADGIPLESDDLATSAVAGFVNGRSEQLVVLNQFTQDESIGMRNDATVYEYTSYGYSSAENGKALVKVGFKKDVIGYTAP